MMFCLTKLSCAYVELWVTGRYTECTVAPAVLNVNYLLMNMLA